MPENGFKDEMFLDTQKGQSIIRGVEIGLVALSLAASVASLVVVLTPKNDTTITHLVSFRNYDSSLITTETINDGEVAIDPEITPTKPADQVNTYSFSGWDKDFTIAITEDMTYTAQYSETLIPVTPVDTYYSVKFVNYDGSMLDSQSIKKGEYATYKGITTPIRPTDESYSYTFKGWKEGATSDVVINADTTFNADYTKTPVTKDTYYTVTFKNWDGNICDTQSIKKGEYATKPATDPQRGEDSDYKYTFTGWDSDLATTKINANTTFTAQFTPTEKKKDHVVLFRNGDNSLCDYKVVADGGTASTIATPKDATSPYYNSGAFDDWYTTNGGDTKATLTNITQDTEVWAKFARTHKIKQVTGGSVSAAILTMDGSLYTFGSNAVGTLGNGSSDTTQVINIPTKITLDNQQQALPKFVSVSSGFGYSNDHVLALSESGDIYSWGNDENGGLGNGPTETGNVTAPEKITVEGVKFSAISSTLYNGYAISNSGDIYSWGADGYGQLGNGSSSSDNVVVPTKIEVSGVSFTSISSSSNNACVALSKTGDIYTWGYDGRGILGNGTSLTSDVTVPTKIEVSGVSFASVSLLCANILALTKSGEIYTWGGDTYGELGNGSSETADVASPEKITVDGVSFDSVSAGECFSAAISDSGDIFTWGHDVCGQLGNGEDVTSDISKPEKINVSGVKFSQVCCSPLYTLAISSSNELYTWGFNYYGQLGNGLTSGNVSSPELREIPYNS